MSDHEEDTPQQEVPGHRVIAGYLRTLDASPGVYRMLDAQNRVLYVGKARNLKARVSSYARPTGHSARIARMIRETTSMMFLTTRTETEALLLEQNLIKQLKPLYNVLLRDDKSFPNILVTDHPFPMIKKHRGAKKEKGRYYGPFAGAGAVNRALAQLQRVFLLRNCSDAMFESRTRPCLQYQIKRCTAPCVGKISEADYARSVRDAERYLSGRSTEIQENLAADMQAASDAMEFERAAALRDRIKALTQVQTAQGINPRSTSEADVIALHLDGGQACVQVFFIRAGQNWGNRDFYPRVGSSEIEAAEVLEAFIGQFYDNKEPPKQLLLSHPLENADLMAQALSDKAGRKVAILVPQRGEKAELVGNAARNARESLARKMAETATQGRLLKGLADAFGLDAPPARIEVYDNSHIQGAHAVGAMIVAGPDGMMKNQYRKFNIRGDDLTPGDDFGMMKEVLTRRFKRLIKDDPDRSEGHWPDLLLIDGGAGQVSAVKEIMDEMGVADIPMVGVAKGIDRDAGKEEFHRPGARPFALRHNDPVLYFIQRLRDEAHRFAIGAHRAKRSKAVGATPLDDVPGVGATRKRALLAHFGSAKAVSRAALADLKAVEGISDSLAEKIYDFFHDAG
ncbi:excinuclease ABC subunit UvrC [Aquicoccus porphyridii]|uniref:UvrABC system protein C n=1 Tax=Aquicoccus porphyridii TaxID=1852029 RepID=A0A5A9Z5D7_9RHOB|nr:excinuclease ABC subunit UvrC [Aquicoccus porphyridii]KAA0912229.1 excinuclease ABC subunit UvrC [Aquicoccus porphyridii]RAI52922.1 excinuclease ABC subunit C [Rhodobacteraceae bacterium AsT-22]